MKVQSEKGYNHKVNKCQKNVKEEKLSKKKMKGEENTMYVQIKKQENIMHCLSAHKFTFSFLQVLGLESKAGGQETAISIQ